MKLEKGLLFIDNYNKDIYYFCDENKEGYLQIIQWQRSPSQIKSGWNDIETWKSFFEYTSEKNQGRIQPFSEASVTIKRKRKMLAQVFTL